MVTLTRPQLVPGFARASTVDVTVLGGAIDRQALTMIYGGPTTVVPGNDATSAAAAPMSGDTRYEIVGKLGAGGMGEVLAARDRGLRRVVAFKKLLPEAANNASLLGRFVSEAQITSQLDHPNVVPIYGLEVGDNGTLAYAMKLIDGVELADQLAAASAAEAAGIEPPHGLELAARLEVFVKVCDAMAFAHSRGVLHRDLKPANVMVGHYGQVYVVDWGIARVIGPRGAPQDADAGMVEQTSDDATRTRIGQALGTPAYMSPEQAMGHNDAMDARSDIFTLGLILQEVVSLRRARDGATVVETLVAAAEGTKNALVHIGHRPIARELDAIIARATAFDTADRYASVEALADDVRAYLRGDAVSARPDTRWQRIGRWVAKHRMKALALFVTTLVVVPLAVALAGVLMHEAKVEALHQREAHLTALLSDVALRASHFDAELHRYEATAREAAGIVSALTPADDDKRLQRHLAALAATPIDGQKIGALRVETLASGRGARLAAGDTPAWIAVESPDSDTGFVVRFVTPVVHLEGDVSDAHDVIIDMSPAALSDDLALPAHPAVRESLLVRPDGAEAGHVLHGGAGLDLRSVLAPLVERLAREPSGWREEVIDGQDLIVAWHTVESLGWAYVAIVDRAGLEAEAL